MSLYKLTDFCNDNHKQAMSDHPHKAGQTRLYAAYSDLSQDKK